MAKKVSKIQLEKNGVIEDFYFDATTGVKGYDLYSTDATVVGKWVDGKPIYRKVIKTTLTNPTDVAIDINDTVDSFVSVSGNAYDSGNNYTIDWRLPFARHDSFAYQIGVQGNNNNSTASGSQRKNTVRLVFGSNLVNRTWKVDIIVEYTRTTDQPDSFVEEKVELTAEHKTGETFNGKDVYESYIYAARVPANTSAKLADVTSLNIGLVVDINSKFDVMSSIGVRESFYSSNTNYGFGWVDKTKTGLYYRAGIAITDIVVKLKYTKTT